MRYKIIACFALCFVLLIFIFGCGEDFPILTETLDITNLTVTQSSIGVGETTTIEAVVNYSGDETVLLYTWTVDAGSIQGFDSRATYIAPGDQGIYVISLRVSDGVISDERTVEINVGKQSVESMILDFDTHWPAEAHKDSLAYSVNIKNVVSDKVLIHYDITQDQDEFDAFLSIQVDQTVVLEETAIGAEQPSTAKRTVDEVDASHIIVAPGRYMVTFYIRPGNRVLNGWLLNEAKIIGVQGTSDPQQ
jgi:hypothetical protein